MKKLCRIIALIMSFVMLLSATALAAGKELSINDVVINVTEGDETLTLDFTGLGLNLGFAEKDGGAGMHLGLSAAGSSVADIQACVQGERLLLTADGLSNVYSLDLSGMANELAAQMPVDMNNLGLSGADLAALEALNAQWLTVFGSAVTMEGSEENVRFIIDVSEEQVDSLLAAMAVLLDNHPELFVDSGFENFSDVLNNMAAKLSIRGEAVMTEAGLSGQVFLIAREIESGEEEGIALSGDIVFGEEDGMEVIAATIALGAGETAENFEEEGYIEFSLGLMEGEFALTELMLYEADDEAEGMFFSLSSPLVSEEESWEFVMMPLDGEEGLVVSIGDGFGYVSLIAGEEGITFEYAVENGAANYALNILADGVGIEGIATGTISDSDGAWMIPADAEAIDVMTLDEKQSSALMMEAMAIVMNAMASMAQANAFVGELIGTMM